MRKNYFLIILLISTVGVFAQPGTQTDVISINSFLPFQGYDESQAFVGQGEYQIFYDNVDGVFDKPVVIVDGYDPSDGRDIPIIFDSFLYNAGANNYLTDWRNQGLDIVILNFPTYVRSADNTTINGGADYIERNGLILVNLLQTLFPQIQSNYGFVVFGPSMGGLVSRYALRYMEQNSLDHHTDLWFSFDSPHFGANIPISFQYMFNYFVETNGTADEIAQKNELLNNPAARQMLLDHYVAHLQSGSAYLQNTAIKLPTPHPFRTTFMNTMNAMGFPTQPRNVAISNGVTNGTGTYSPGATVINTTLDLGSGITTQIRMHFTPVANTSNYEVDYSRNYLFGFPVGSAFTAYAASPSYTSGYDAAPGSTQSADLIFGENPTGVLASFVNALQVNEFCFIPTVSSLAVNNQNVYAPISTGSITEFDAYLIPSVNEIHMTYTQPTIDFITNEMLNYYLSDENYHQHQIQLVQNPVKDYIRLEFDTVLNTNSTYQIIDTFGKIIQKGNVNAINNECVIPVKLSSGIYLLKVNNEKTNQTFKVIVE